MFWISTMTNSPFLFSTRISTRLNLSSSVSLFPSLSRICFILKSSWSNSERKPSKISKLALLRSSRIFRADAPNFCPPSLTAVRQNRCQSIYYICRGGLICQDRSAIFRADAPNICPPSLPTVRQNLLKINILICRGGPSARPGAQSSGRMPCRKSISISVVALGFPFLLWLTIAYPTTNE